jgi:hypothetical protein
VHGALEVLAARPATEKLGDKARVEEGLSTMQRTAERNDLAGLLDANLSFYLGALSNRFRRGRAVEQYVKKVVVRITATAYGSWKRPPDA